MSSRILLALCTVAASAFANPLHAQYQQANVTPDEFIVDRVLAESGRKTFAARGCIGCHTVGKGELSAPDLGGLLERRTVAWAKKWLRDPPAMLATDETAKSLLKKYPGFRMPNLKLSEDEITALLHYIAAETKATKGIIAPSQ
jgi:protein SCO1